MADRTLAILDGSAEAAALADFLRGRGILLERVEAFGPSSAVDEALRRLSVRGRRRIVLLSTETVRGAIDARQAIHAVEATLGGMDAFQRRTLGSETLVRVAATRPESLEPVAELERRLRGRSAASAVRAVGGGRRGRPPGTNPFKGVGLEVACLLVADPGRRWTERELAQRLGRAPSSVGRMTLELARQGYVLTGRSGTRLIEPAPFIERWVATWRENARGRRTTQWRRPPGDGGPIDLGSSLAALPEAVFAGPSALPEAIDQIDAPPTLYVSDRDAAPTGLVPSNGGRADLILWPASDTSVFALPRGTRPLASTNAFVCFLDLAASGVARWEEAADRLRGTWETARD